MRGFLDGLRTVMRRAQIGRGGLEARAATLALGCETASCADMLHGRVAWRRLRGLAQVQDASRISRAIKPTAMAIDLGAFADFEAWERAVSAATDGKYRRSANRARRLGFFVRQIGVGSYEASLYAIRASKLRRSKGVVWEARDASGTDKADVERPVEAPTCDRHWRLDWAVLRTEGGGTRMAAYASLLRAGNGAELLHFIGHGDHLADGVTKLLLFEIMRWLLARENGAVQGLETLFYGTVEEGNAGLLDFKRYMAFAPALIDCAAPPDDRPPDNFDGALYLELNPDVAKAGVNPYQHYLMDGMLEGRPTQRARQDENA